MFINPQTLEVESLDELLAVTQYRPKVPTSVQVGFQLADNLNNAKGGVLYAKGADLDFEKIERLIRLQETNSEFELIFSIQKNDQLAGTFRDRILGDFNRFLASRKARNEFRRFMEKVETNLEATLEQMFSNSELYYLLVQMKMSEQSNAKDGATPVFNHLLNTVLITIGIFLQTYAVTNKKFTKEDIVNGACIALLLGLGGAETMPLYKEKPEEERKLRFLEGNKNSWSIASRLGMANEVVEGLKLVANYNSENPEWIEKDDPIADLANIVLVADMLDTRITGLFGNPSAPKDVVDNLYVTATQGKVAKTYVDALAKGMTFGYLFDFYYEVEKLNKSCPYSHGRAYPMTGFKSPVIYVCKGRLSTCPHYGASAKAVTVIRPNSGLDEGSYGRCEWLSRALIKFYDGFYDQIKEDTMSRPEKEG